MDSAANHQARRRRRGEGDDAQLVGDDDECQRKVCLGPNLVATNERLQ
jgi:hypothetical protein